MIYLFGMPGTGEWIIIVLFFSGFILFIPFITLIDIVKSNFKESNDKLIWVLIVLFLNLFGCLLYLIAGRQQKIQKV